MALIKYDDLEYLTDFRRYIKERETVMSSGVHPENTKRIYSDLIVPMLKLGQLKGKLTKQDRKKFIGEVFALSLYAKKHRVDSWNYEPRLGDKTPDFIINSSTYLEVYSPRLNNGVGGTEYYTQMDKKNVADKVERKSKKYKNHPLLIIVNIVVNDFVEDFVETLSKRKLASNKHSVYFYQGDTEYEINT